MAQPKKDKNKNSLFLHCLTFIKKKKKNRQTILNHNYILLPGENQLDVG